PDPLSRAAKVLFGLDYLYPYQRLVIANILEAACVAGKRVRWPWEGGNGDGPEADGGALSDAPEGALSGAAEIEDSGEMGRQLVILPTGAGKSLCFQLPAQLLEGPTLVIYPILSLMADQERRLASLGFAPVQIRGGQSAGEREELFRRIRSGESRFIIANPEVLITPKVLKELESLNIFHLVIDEAHCVSEWGESFRPSYLEIHSIIKASRCPLVTAFTATASSPVLEGIERRVFGGGGVHRVIGNPGRINISYEAKGCILKNIAVRDLLIARKRPAIVFCSSRKGTETLSRYLRFELEGTAAKGQSEIYFYHAGLEREEKKNVETWFLGSQEGVLCATCAFGLGVDKADIRTVIHRDCPSTVEAYLQESGRAGRDGKNAEALLLFGPDDERRLARMGGVQKERFLRLLDYARNSERCRRKTLLSLLDYQGEAEIPDGFCCDVCERKKAGAKPGHSGYREEKSVLDFFSRNKRRCTLSEAAREMEQAGTIRWTETDAKEIIRYLLAAGRLKEGKSFLWKGKLTCKKVQPSSRLRSSSSSPVT
ncbi:MAG: RecQ family ATP-dependent DNA helicase, partial [Spirochaetaceae bacterium]|nr:RecQ family ATP-dependent DNA helicase [Spirochaetaceae bacterium]